VDSFSHINRCAKDNHEENEPKNFFYFGVVKEASRISYHEWLILPKNTKLVKKIGNMTSWFDGTKEGKVHTLKDCMMKVLISIENQ
jgi:hypothetical protein